MPLSSRGSAIPANLNKLTNVQLVHKIANEPWNEEAWREFLHRFHKYVSFTIYSVCKRLGYTEGVAKVEDLTQEVYLKLLNNDCEPLKRFTSLYENAILKHLKMTAIRAVYTDYTAWKAKKRRPAGGIVSLHQQAEWSIHENRKLDLMDILPANDFGDTSELIEEIQFCLNMILHRSRNADRNKLLFEYYFYHGFDAVEIASQICVNLTAKRVGKLISEIKQAVRRCLRDHGIAG